MTSARIQALVAVTVVAIASTFALFAQEAVATPPTAASGTFVATAVVTSVRVADGNRIITNDLAGVLRGTYDGTITGKSTVVVHADGRGNIHGEVLCVCTVAGQGSGTLTFRFAGVGTSATPQGRYRIVGSSGALAGAHGVGRFSGTGGAGTYRGSQRFDHSPPPVRPALLQNVSTNTNRDNEAGNDFIINLPNATLASNCLILALSNAYSATRTITISDDKGNVWTAGPHVDFVANTTTTTIFYALGVAAGTQRITVHFDAAILNVHATLSEWSGIATSAAANGSSAAFGVVSPVSAGSFTPGNNDANGGNLIYHHAIAAGSLGNLAGNLSAITVGAGFTLASANRQLAAVSQYTVQTTAAAINPTLTLPQAPSGNAFNTIAVAFKAAAAGTAPAGGIRIRNMQHTYHPVPGANTVNLPSSGNLLVLTTPVNTNQNAITAVSDSKGNTWSKLAGESLDSPQFWYAAGAVPANDLTVSFSMANQTGFVVIVWDIAGAAAAPLDRFSEATGAQQSAGDDITAAPVITPASAGGLVIGAINEYTGPPTSMIGAGYVADHIFYTGQTDLSLMDYGDGTAHIYNADTSQLSFGWHQTTHPPTSGWFALAVAFKAGPSVPPTPPPQASPGETGDDERETGDDERETGDDERDTLRPPRRDD